MSRSWSRWHTKIFPQPSSSPFLPLPCSMVCIFQAVNCPHLRRQYMFNECFSCICIGFSEFNKPAMCRISHCHFFSIMLFVLPFRTEHSTYFILSKVCHFVGRLKHKYYYYYQANFGLSRIPLIFSVEDNYSFLWRNITFIWTNSIFSLLYRKVF